MAKEVMQLRLVVQPEYNRRLRAHRCVVAFCSNRGGHDGRDRFCHKHARQHQKINNPLRYWYDILRQNARRRRKPFELTIEQFRDFCEQTGYLEKKGRNSGAYSIDRIDNELGYTIENIQIMEFGSNSRKYWIDMKIQYGFIPTEEQLEEWRNDLSSEGQPNPQIKEPDDWIF